MKTATDVYEENEVSDLISLYLFHLIFPLEMFSCGFILDFNCFLSVANKYIISIRFHLQLLGNRQVVSSADVCNTSNMNANSDMVSSLSADSLSNERPISRRRQNTTTSRDLMHINNNNNNRNNQQPRSSSTSFFAIFYERPVRHRYYRQINRSATNLVRRLSQSRLILNSSRAQNAAQRSHFTRRTRTDASTAADIPQQQDIEQQSQRATETAVMLNNNDTIDSQQNQNQSDDCLLHRTRASIHSLNISNDCDQNMIENRLSAIRSVASENDLFRNDGRSETPPPPYNVVVHHRKE